jgi:carbon-monoxide dehydrogenase medium subunit
MKMHMIEPSLLVDLSAVRGLDFIREGPGGTVELGAMTRLADLVRDTWIKRRLPILAVVAASIGDRHVREMSTVGGSLAFASPAGDLCTLALLLDAAIVTTQRDVPAADFFRGPFSTALDTGELVISVRFPPATGPHAYLKVGGWSQRGVPSVGVQWIDGAWRIALGNVGHHQSRATEVEKALNSGIAVRAAVDQAWSDLELLAADSIPLAYKMQMARVLARRAIESADPSQ